ncbi:unnamed protein product [Callosobruchus maculatus]|uniref:Uncharacterized protein n=1 Tax=Callosobruchus maculatus TaxID=64391 RepID=A0A653CNU4_CALMS|nr:unnamed protein product [Callosobruchus maculatus]
MNANKSSLPMSVCYIWRLLWNHAVQLIILRLLTQVPAAQIGSNRMQHNSGPGVGVAEHFIVLNITPGMHGSITRNSSIDSMMYWPLASKTKSILSTLNNNSASDHNTKIHQKVRRKILHQFDIVNNDFGKLIIADAKGHHLLRETIFGQTELARFVRSTFAQRQCVISKNKLTELDKLTQNILLNTTLNYKTTDCKLTSADMEASLVARRSHIDDNITSH